MHGIARTICGVLACGSLFVLAAEPEAAPPDARQRIEADAAQGAVARAADSLPAAAGGSEPAVTGQSGALLAASGAAQLQTEASYALAAAGICPVIAELVQQSCVQYPDDPSCRAQ